MSLLSEVKTILEEMSVPVETGVFSKTPPERYVVLTPLSDAFVLYSDNVPEEDVEEVRISLFDKGNYLALKRRLTSSLTSSEITITDRRYVGHENDTGYHHYAIDVAKNYFIQEDE